MQPFLVRWARRFVQMWLSALHEITKFRVQKPGHKDSDQFILILGDLSKVKTNKRIRRCYCESRLADDQPERRDVQLLIPSCSDAYLLKILLFLKKTRNVIVMLGLKNKIKMR